MKVASQCHYCNSNNINEKSVTKQGKKMVIDVHCLDCMKNWTEYWSLTRIERYTVKKGEKVAVATA